MYNIEISKMIKGNHLRYLDKVTISRNKQLDEYRKEILKILEDSKVLVMECDNLVKMRALKTRCEKISRPRTGPSHDERRDYRQKRYKENKEEISNRQREKRQKIREITLENVQ